MTAMDEFNRTEMRYEEAGKALSGLISSLEVSDKEDEQNLATGLRKAPERVKFLNLPSNTGIGMEAFHNPILTFNARNWDRATEVANLILKFADARRKYERAYTALPASDRPRMKEPDDFIDAVS